jgi:sugar (pentulose or hexulose) kinase
MEVLRETVAAFGVEADAPANFERLLPLALEGDPDCGGLLSYAFVSGEHVAGLSEGRPLFARTPEANFTLANFLRCHLFSALCAMRCGLDILFDEENVQVDEIRGHGGFFKTPGVGERIMAAATKTPVSVLATAGEGGAWGIALLAAFSARSERDLSLPEFLAPVFAGSEGTPVAPDPDDMAGFDRFLDRHREGMPIERAAVERFSVA